jgi:hypothetical protein
MKTALAATGVFCIGGGEAFCLFGPIRYQDVVHILCHVILYSGMVLVAGAAALHAIHIRRQRRSSASG